MAKSQIDIEIQRLIAKKPEYEISICVRVLLYVFKIICETSIMQTTLSFFFLTAIFLNFIFSFTTLTFRSQREIDLYFRFDHFEL